MAAKGLQLLGCTLALLGWVGAILICGLPTWRVMSFTGNSTVTSQVFWEGLWMSCEVENTGKLQCKTYDSMLDLSLDLQAARFLVVGSMLLGIIGLRIAFTSAKCNKLILEENRKKKAAIASGVILIISGVFCLIPVSWTASMTGSDFYSREQPDGQRYELGASLYIGWVAGILLVAGGGLLCSFCPKQDDLKYHRSQTSL